MDFLMLKAGVKIAVCFAFVAVTSACSRDGNNGTSILNLRQSAIAPDEFLVVPQKPLETPADLTVLPQPDPGATSRVEIDFEADLLTALGGRNGSSGQIPASEVALVNAARAQFGTTENIRDLVRADDQAFRDARKGRIERLAKKRVAVSAYDPMLLDPMGEVARLRALGVKTPAVPAP